LDLSSFPASLIEEVIVPDPGELFTLLDKLPGQPNWAGWVRQEFPGQAPTDRTRLALWFGTLIADGFIAVQAENAEGVEGAGKRILELAETLGLRDAVVPHSRAILEACEARDWEQVRQELDRTHRTVREQMERMRDEDLAQCVSVAGWVRGTEVLTRLIAESYSRDKAEILHQPDLADHFIERLGGLQASGEGSAEVAEILEGLRTVRDLMSMPPEESLSAESVARIHGICSDLVNRITPR
jgi:leucyl aminopeptidase